MGANGKIRVAADDPLASALLTVLGCPKHVISLVLNIKAGELMSVIVEYHPEEEFQKKWAQETVLKSLLTTYVLVPKDEFDKLNQP